MTDQAPELLPCPFCGSRPAYRGNGVPLIFCENSDCFGPRTTAGNFDDAVLQWNIRTKQQSILAFGEDRCKCSQPDVCMEAGECLEKAALTRPTPAERPSALDKISDQLAMPRPRERPVPQVREADCCAGCGGPIPGHHSIKYLCPQCRELCASRLTARPSDAAVAWQARQKRGDALGAWHDVPAQRANCNPDYEYRPLYTLPPSPHVEYSASRGQSQVTYWVTREEGDSIRNRALYALPPDEPARVTPSTVGGEALRQIVARTYSTDRRCRLDYEAVAEIYDIASAALSPTIASEKEPVQASIDQRGPDVPGLGRDYR